MDIFDRMKLQTSRLSAYRNGDYELDEWEGFVCPDCGNRELTAEMSDDYDDIMSTICSECESVTETSGKETDWERVKEKIPEEYLTGEAMETDDPECPRCETDMTDSDDTHTLSFQDKEATIHERCMESIWENNIENPIWYDTFTPEHYEKAADYLRSLDCVGEVITNGGRMYGFGEMFIHTNYATTEVVSDVIDNFNGRIVSASVATDKGDKGFDCVSEHGKCFEILIDFCTDKGSICPPHYLDEFSRDDDGPMWSQDYFITDSDMYEPEFDADFEIMTDMPPEKVPEKLR